MRLMKSIIIISIHFFLLYSFMDIDKSYPELFTDSTRFIFYLGIGLSYIYQAVKDITTPEEK